MQGGFSAYLHEFKIHKYFYRCRFARGSAVLVCPFSLAIAAGRFISPVGVTRRARTAAPVNNSQRLLPCGLSIPLAALPLSRHPRRASNANTPPSNSVSRPAKIISNYAPVALPEKRCNFHPSTVVFTAPSLWDFLPFVSRSFSFASFSIIGSEFGLPFAPKIFIIYVKTN